MTQANKKVGRNRDRWLKIDWSNSDAEIARNLCVTKETVFYHRKKHTNYQPAQREMVDWDSVDISQPAKRVAKKLGITEKQVRKRRYYLRVHKSKRVVSDRASRWDDVDWCKSVSDIAKELGVSKQAVYNRKNKISLKAVVTVDLPEQGYTPKNYQALVELTKISNADFYRTFEIPEQTFYHHYSGTRTMKWQEWQALVDAVTGYITDIA